MPAETTWVDEKGRTRRGKKPAAATSPPSPTAPKAKKQEKEPAMADTKKRGRRTGTTYNPPTISGTADEAPARGRPSMYQPLIEQIVATGAESPGKWVIVNPEGRKPTSFRSALAAAARKMDPALTLETSEGEVDGTMMVYVRVKPEG